MARRMIGVPVGRAQRWTVTGAVFVVFVLVWLWASQTTGRGNFPPSPGKAIGRIVTDASGPLWTDIWASTWRIVIAFAFSTALALPLGVLAGISRRWEAGVVPFSEFIRYMPVTGFGSLSIVWFGLDEKQKWFIIWLGTFFQQVLMVIDDTKRVPREFVDVGRTLGMDDRRILRDIVVRAAAPRIWDSTRLALGWAWTWVVLAELVNADNGLGHAIENGRRLFQYDKIIAYLVVLGIIGLITDQTLRAVGRRLFRHEQVRT